MNEAALTVVIPAYNSEAHIRATIDALVAAAEQSPFRTNIVLVDDGSTDSTAAVATEACADRLPLRVISQENRGRFEARRAGLEAVTGEWVLLLDSRVTLEPSSLAFVSRKLDEGAEVWNGHVHVRTEGNPFGAFWKAVAFVAWKDYLADPRETSFGADDFDRYPKGTGCFLARRTLLVESIAAFRSRYDDLRVVSDDTAVIRWIAQRQPIRLSPEFGCEYEARSTLGSFFRQGLYRGTTFVDGHLRQESRFFAGAVAFFPLSVLLGLAITRKPILAPIAGVTGAAAAGAVASLAGCPSEETRAVALLAPVYAVAHGAGMWRGLAMLVRNRLGAS
jgi:glycosyltransferase involved in cell wall biosynthesis